MPLDFADADEGALTVFPDGDFVLVGEFVDDLEADVMTRTLVLGAGVAETDDEILRRIDGAARFL